MNLNPIRALRFLRRAIGRRDLSDAERASLLKLGLAVIFFAIIAPKGLFARLTGRLPDFDRRPGGWREIDESTADLRAYDRQL
jgi:hypothetical protein